MFSASALSGVRLRKVAPVEVDEAAETARLAAAVAAEKRAAEEEPARRTEFFAAGGEPEFFFQVELAAVLPLLHLAPRLKLGGTQGTDTLGFMYYRH
jgi:hypothetical protein